MSPEPQPEIPSLIQFASFELDPRSGVLRKSGIRIRLQEQPLRVLLALLESPGEVMTREELKEKIWAGTEFGDFDHSLNIAVNKIREALSDSSATPRYVETIPRRGYRFIAAVHRPIRPATQAADLEVVPKKQAPAVKRTSRVPLISAAAAIVVVAGMGLVRLMPSAPSGEFQTRRLTNDNSPKFGPVLSDGARLYFQAGSRFGSYIAQLPLSGGEPVKLPLSLPTGPYLGLLDITPNRQELLLAASERPTWALHRHEPASLWTFRIADGTTRRVGTLLAQDARYSPDGEQIAFVVARESTPGSIWIAASDGSGPRRVLETAGFDVIAPCWSPDGKQIAFGERSQRNLFTTGWVMRANGTGLRQLFPDWHRPHWPTGWAPDGRLLLSSQGRLWTAKPLGVMQTASALPSPVSADEPAFNGPVQPDPRGIHGIGATRLGQLQRYDLQRGTWEPHLAGVSAEMVEYSRDGQRLAYSTYPEHELWTRYTDGSRPARLTNTPMLGILPRWAPDGKVIGFLGGSANDDLRRIYLIDADGGTPRLACRNECGTEGDFTWSPDRKRIIYDTGRLALRSLDLSTATAQKLPASDDLYSPRGSPDGTMLAALDWKSPSSLALLSYSDGKWKRTPPAGGYLKWPCWSRDSRFIWYLNAVKGTIGKYDVRHDRHEDVVTINMEELTGAVDTWFALSASDEPMILRRRDIQQVYALEWKTR